MINGTKAAILLGMDKQNLPICGNLLYQFPFLIGDIIAPMLSFIGICGPEVATREKIVKEHDIEGFNIFTSIAPDRYWHELFHSRIVSLLLDPKTPKIGNSRYLKKFVAAVCDRNNRIQYHDFSRAVSIIRESDKIDIFIHDKTHGIIIENKLNNAVDQPDQLARYVQSVKAKGIEIVAVVYIPLYDKQPPLDEYSDEYKEIREEIRQKLAVFPAIALAEEFLDPCAKMAEHELGRVFINEYSKVLKHLGGSLMTKEIDLELLKKVFSSRETIIAAKNIAEVWEQRTELLIDELYGMFQEKLVNELDYETEGARWTGKAINKNTSIGCELCDDEEPHYCWIGFYGDNKTIKVLEEVINQPEFQKDFPDIGQDTGYTGRCFYPVDGFTGTLEEKAAFLVDKLRLLEERAREALGLKG